MNTNVHVNIIVNKQIPFQTALKKTSFSFYFSVRARSPSFEPEHVNEGTYLGLSSPCLSPEAKPVAKDSWKTTREKILHLKTLMITPNVSVCL